MIELAGIVKRFRDADREVPVLDGLSLSVADGEMVAVVGASGSGKSTLLYLVGGLDADFEGQARVAGRDLGTLSERERATFRGREVGFVFQSFNLLPHLTAMENVCLPAWFAEGPALRAEAPRRGAEALRRVGLLELAGQRPARLSGGQRQRVAIARALFAGPRLLLADEPTGNLDTRSGEEIIDLFGELSRGGMTVLVVTHEERVSRAAGRVLRLEAGRLA
ncbi:MAG: ABC transporter ATP-binding protein [Deltaproteobacteria bacterium]|nr:ABC transporter ATP-binding protein [Deltaproteobacteria bacterium]